MKVIIAGSRWIENYEIVKQAIEESSFKITEVVSGVAKGADTLGENWAELNDIPVKQFPALWSKLKVQGAVIRQNEHGKYNAAAGGIRNQQMSEYADALICLWDGTSRGSGDVILKAHAGGLKVFVFLVE